MEKVTGNAQLLLGYISGLLIQDGQRDELEPLYVLSSVDPTAGVVEVVAHSGNTYRLSIVQIGGEE